MSDYHYLARAWSKLKTDFISWSRTHLFTHMLQLRMRLTGCVYSKAVAAMRTILDGELTAIKSAGTWKTERVITTPMAPYIGVTTSADKVNKKHLIQECNMIKYRDYIYFMLQDFHFTAIFELFAFQVLNFCSNNYLGLSSHPEVIEAGRQALTDFGNGVSSVRFICGTQVSFNFFVKILNAITCSSH